MKDQFVKEAVENGAFPLDDRLLERLLPEVVGRPNNGRSHQSYFVSGCNQH